MIKISINKEEVLPQFMSGNIANFGEAAGLLKPCGFKLYVYLMCNANGFQWTLNPAAFAAWQGVPNSRGVRKQVDDGLKDLVDNGFAQEAGLGEYEFFEKHIKVEQIVPKSEQKVPELEQIVPSKTSIIKSLGF